MVGICCRVVRFSFLRSRLIEKRFCKMIKRMLFRFLLEVEGFLLI